MLYTLGLCCTPSACTVHPRPVLYTLSLYCTPSAFAVHPRPVLYTLGLCCAPLACTVHPRPFLYTLYFRCASVCTAHTLYFILRDHCIHVISAQYSMLAGLPVRMPDYSSVEPVNAPTDRHTKPVHLYTMLSTNLDMRQLRIICQADIHAVKFICCLKKMVIIQDTSKNRRLP